MLTEDPVVGASALSRAITHDACEASRVRWPYYGHNVRQRPQVAALKRAYHPLIRQYRHQIDEDPDPANIETMRAMYVVVLRFARNVKVMHRAIKELDLLRPKAPRGQVAASWTMSREELLEDIRQRLDRMRSEAERKRALSEEASSGRTLVTRAGRLRWLRRRCRRGANLPAVP